MLLHYLDTALRQTNSSDFNVWTSRLQKQMNWISVHQELHGIQASFTCLVSELHHNMQALWLPPLPTPQMLQTLSHLLAFLGRSPVFVLERVETDRIDSFKCLEKKQTNIWATIPKKKDKNEKPLWGVIIENFFGSTPQPHSLWQLSEGVPWSNMFGPGGKTRFVWF